jgi:sRNA-binding protein
MTRDAKGSPLVPVEPSKGDKELTPPNKSPKERRQAWKASAIETLIALHKRFPSCFAPLRQSHRWPIKIGVHIDLLEAAPDLPPEAIGRALAFYTTGPAYLQSMLPGRTRIDLSGAAFGCVTPEQAATSKQRLAKRQPRQKATPPPPTPPKRLTLSDLKKAALARRARGEP